MDRQLGQDGPSFIGEVATREHVYVKHAWPLKRGALAMNSSWHVSDQMKIGLPPACHALERIRRVVILFVAFPIVVFLVKN